MSVRIGAAPTTAPAATEQETWHQKENHSGKRCFGSGSVSGSGLDPTTAQAATEQETWRQHENHSGKQCFRFGSVFGSGLDPTTATAATEQEAWHQNQNHSGKQCLGSGSVSWSGMDPDPGRQRLPTKLEKVNKFRFFKCSMFSFERWRLPCSFDVHYGELGISRLYFFPSNFWSSKPWIRIRIRIHNTAGKLQNKIGNENENSFCTKLPWFLLQSSGITKPCQCCGSGSVSEWKAGSGSASELKAESVSASKSKAGSSIRIRTRVKIH